MAATAYEGHAIVEIMGHVRLAGRVSEAQQYGAVMLRVDIPEVPAAGAAAAVPGFTRFYGGGAIYSVTPTTEEIAVAFTRRARPVPVQRFDLALPAMASQPPDAELVGGGKDQPGTCVDCGHVDCICDEAVEAGDENGDPTW